MKVTFLVLGFTFMLALVPSSKITSKSKSSKITICHFPPGNPSNVQSITISKKALKAHLAHGDFIGNCNDSGEEVQQ